MSTTLSPSLSEAEYNRFREFFYRRTGIAFASNRRYYVESRMAGRLRETSARSFGDYLALLRAPDAVAELEHLINLFTVNETYFYREAHQFETLAYALLPEITARRPPGSRLRILSLPCATGEEPYSIALYLIQHWPALMAYQVELLAADIDTEALAAARAGIYNARAVERLPPPLLQSYFSPMADGGYRIDKSLREAVQFSHVNVTNPAQMRQFTDVDVLFCRNMLIYFDDSSRFETMRQFYQALSPGGFVCLGHSESMSRICGLFAVRAFGRSIVYQKPLDPP